MKQRRVILFLFLALVAASVAGFSALKYAASRPAIARPGAETPSADVVVATRDLPVGSVVSEEDVQVVKWPGNAIPEGYIATPEDAVGRGLIADIRMNEPYLQSKLAEKGTGGGLAIVVPEGMRAMSVRVDEVIGVAGFVVPGTRVDVLLTMQPPSASDTYTQIILQNVTVLANNQTVQRDEDGKPITATVSTLLVTPEQAEQLTLAASQGRIQFALRNMLDVDSINTPGYRSASLIQPGRAPSRASGRARPTVTRRPDNVVELYRGGQRTIQRF